MTLARRTVVRLMLACLLPAPIASAETTPPIADLLFVGSYHMGNPGRDVANLDADDVTAPARQRQIRDVVDRLLRYQPTRVVVERHPQRQAELDARFQATCHGDAPYAADEVEQLGMRTACALGLTGVVAVDSSGLDSIDDPSTIDYAAAARRHDQHALYDAFLQDVEAMVARDQEVLRTGTIVDMLRRLNTPAWLDANARGYIQLGLLGTEEDPVGARWMQVWYGRNLAIFNAIRRATAPGDRVLVIYGAGHGNLIRQLAGESGDYRMHDPLGWLGASSPDAP